MAGPAGGESPGLLPARGEPALHAVLRAPPSRADAAIGIDAQIEAHAAVLEYPQTIVQPVIPPVLGAPMPNRGVRSEPERVAILLPSGVMGSAEFSDTTASRQRSLPRTTTPSHGVVARIVTGPHDANRQDPHLPMRYDTGRPRAVIRFKISQPRMTSLLCVSNSQFSRCIQD